MRKIKLKKKLKKLGNISEKRHKSSRLIINASPEIRPIYLKKKMHAHDPRAILGYIPQSNHHSGDVVKAFQVDSDPQS